MIDGVDSSIDGGIFPISTNDIEVPTIMWIENLTDENGNIYEKTPYNITIKDVKGVVPYIGLKNGFECGDTGNETPPNPWLDINKNNNAAIVFVPICSRCQKPIKNGVSIDAHYSYFCHQVYPLMCINCDATFKNIVTPNIDYIKETGDTVNMFDYIEELNH